MTLQEIVTSPDFAGLYWSIPRDTPDEFREAAHISAALRAKAVRDRERDRPISLLYNVQTRQHLLAWPNSSLVWTSDLEIAANRWNWKGPQR